MICSLRSFGLEGIRGYEVSVEADISQGLPAFDVVGLPDMAVREARERIRAAIKSYDLQNFLTENYEGHMVLRGGLALEKLVAGNVYHCTVVVSMGSGEQITVRDFDFTATDADISQPDDSTGEVLPDEDEGDAGIDDPSLSVQV